MVRLLGDVELRTIGIEEVGHFLIGDGDPESRLVIEDLLVSNSRLSPSRMSAGVRLRRANSCWNASSGMFFLASA